jgi:hypothetical protein
MNLKLTTLTNANAFMDTSTRCEVLSSKFELMSLTFQMSLPNKVYDWEQSVYSGAKEMMAEDTTIVYHIPLGKPVVHASVFANLYHNLPHS